MKRSGECACGASRFTVESRPILRIFCHCEICQAFNRSAFSDVTIFAAKGVTLAEDHRVEFQTYRSPPAVQRGKCTVCDEPAIEFLRMPPMPGLAIVPSVNFLGEPALPEPACHIFYHRRVADIDDALPKYSGYWRSQLAMGSRLAMAAMAAMRGSGT